MTHMDSIEELRKDVETLKRMTAFQGAILGAVQAWACREISLATGKDLNVLLQELQDATRAHYERVLLHMGDTDPNFAENVDIRPFLPESVRGKWQDPETRD